MARIPVDPLAGVDAAKAAEIVAAGRLPPRRQGGAAALAERLWAVFTDEDATLVEVNPLVLTGDGRVIALDGKVTLDDNAAFRQDHAQFADPTAADPLEARAKAKHLNYVKLDGQVGIIGNGAGLVMSTLDVVAYAGEAFGGVRPANFLDIGGGASAEVMANGLEIVLSDPSVRSVLVNVFGGITSCDAVANGIVSAHRHARRARRAGAATRSWSGWTATTPPRAAESSPRPGMPVVEQVGTMDDAARRAAELAAAAPRREHEMAIFLTGESRIIVQGITGSEGTQARRPDARPRAPRWSAAPTRARRARRSSSAGPRSRCSARSPRPWRPPARTSRWSSCRRRAPRTR